MSKKPRFIFRTLALAWVHYRGEERLRAGHHRENLEFLERAVERFPEDGGIRLLYGTTLLGFRPMEALSEIEKATELDSENPALLIRAAHIMYDMSDLDRARLYGERARELAPEDFLLMPELLALEKKCAEPEDEGLKREPREIRALRHARELLDLASRAEAVSRVDRVSRRVKRKRVLKLMRAYFAKPEIGPSTPFWGFLRFGRHRSRKRAAAIKRGRELRAADCNQENLEFLEGALRRFPKDPEIRLLYAALLLVLRPDDVATHAAKAAELAASDPGVVFRAGHLLLSSGKIDEARSCFECASALAEPDFVLTSELLDMEGRVAGLDKDHKLAEEKFRAAMEWDPTSEEYAENLARALASQGRFREALEVVDRALERVKKTEDLESLRDRLLAAANEG